MAEQAMAEKQIELAEMMERLESMAARNLGNKDGEEDDKTKMQRHEVAQLADEVAALAQHVAMLRMEADGLYAQELGGH